MTKTQDLTDQRFGRLKVISRAPTPPRGRNAFWTCICDCGNPTIGASANLLGGQKLSCGCWQRETAAERLRNTKYTLMHGMSRTPEHNAWTRMIERCTNPNTRQFQNYGGRGIAVADNWRYDFAQFYADMGPRLSAEHSLDRIDNNGNYTAENCRWATRTEQAGNTRVSRVVTVNGIKMHMAAWIRFLEIPHWKLYESTRTRNRNHPRFASMEAAIAFYLHEKEHGPQPKQPRKNKSGHPKGWRINLTGRRYGKLVVLEYFPFDERRGVHWLCQCDCGNVHVVCTNSLKRKLTISCGCVRSQLSGDRMRTHGMRNAGEYMIWARMRQDVSQLCETWKNSFATFYKDMGERPSTEYSMERINKSQPYSPENCRWSTRRDQANNRRSNRTVVYRGEKMTLRQAWALSNTSIKFGTLRARVFEKHWQIESALLAPLRRNKRWHP